MARRSLLLALACCGPSHHTADAPPMTDAPGDAPTVTTIRELRMHPPADGAIVTVQHVVVTAHVSSTKTGSVWVQDQGGGEYSGIHVFCNFGGAQPDCPLARSQLDALAVGTIVDVTASFSHFTPAAGAKPQLELTAPAISMTGDTARPTALDVAAAAVAKDASATDPYDGGYVHVAAAVTVSSITAGEFAATCTDRSSPPQTGSTYAGFEAAAGGATLAVGLGFYDTLTYCLPCTGVPLPYPCANPVTATEAFTSIAGIVEPDAGFTRLAPVIDGDLAQ
ncbi:MAG: hypothetical protein ACM31C_03815 [Acidobacteriota bacterium]